MSLKVEALTLTERNDKVVIDVELTTEEGKDYVLASTNLWKKVKTLTNTLQNCFSKDDALLILGPFYTPHTPCASLPYYAVSFTIICRKSDKEYFIDEMKGIAENQGFEFGKIENISRLD